MRDDRLHRRDHLEVLLRGRAVVVTGSGRGLGKAYALHAALHGAQVVVNDIDKSAVDEVVDEILRSGGSAVGVDASVATWDGAEEIVETCLEEFGQIDGLVNNAGIMPVSDPWEIDEGDVRRALDVNLAGAIYCGTLALRTMIRQRSGTVVNVTSGAQMGRSLMSIYGATRAGTAALTYSWALDCEPHGVRVNTVWPSAETLISSRYKGTAAALARGPRRRWPPEANAPLVTYLLSDLAADVSGQTFALRGDKLGIVNPPRLSSTLRRDDGWSLEAIADAFDTTLREDLQVIGAPD